MLLEKGRGADGIGGINRYPRNSKKKKSNFRGNKISKIIDTTHGKTMAKRFHYTCKRGNVFCDSMSFYRQPSATLSKGRQGHRIDSFQASWHKNITPRLPLTLSVIPLFCLSGDSMFAFSQAVLKTRAAVPIRIGRYLCQTCRFVPRTEYFIFR